MIFTNSLTHKDLILWEMHGFKNPTRHPGFESPRELVGTTATRSETPGVALLKGSARGLVPQRTSSRTPRGPRQRSGAGDLDALLFGPSTGLEGRAGDGGHWAPGTHRPEAGPPAGAHAAARHEQRGQAAGPAAAPAPQQQAAVRHGGPRAPLGPGVLRRRGPSAGGRTATGGGGGRTRRAHTAGSRTTTAARRAPASPRLRRALPAPAC